MATGGMLSQYLGMLQAGMDPEQIKRMVEEQKALEFAKLTPEQQRGYVLNRNYSQGFQGIMSGLGMKTAEDPVLRQASMLRQLQQRFDTTTPEGMMEYASELRKMGMGTLAAQAADEARKMSTNASQAAKARAEAGKAQLDASRTEQFMAKLDELGPDASDEDYLKIARRYGTPDKVLQSIQTSLNLREQADARAEQVRLQNEAKIEAARIQADARLEAARMQGATAQQIAAMNAENKRMIAEMQANSARQIAELKRNKPGVDKDVAERAETIITTDETIKRGNNLLERVKANPNAFTLTGRMLGAVESVGSGTPRTELQSDVRSYFESARNAYLLLAKGVQTEGDANRAWNNFANSLDFASAAGVKRSIERIKTQLETAKTAQQRYIEMRMGKKEVGASPASQTVKGTKYQIVED